MKLTGEAKKIGAVNALYRKGEDLWGTNTDGEASVLAFENEFGPLKNKKVLIMGLGGVGKAVSIYMKSAVGKDGLVYVTNRSADVKEYAIKQSMGWVNRNQLIEILPKLDLLVNCTTLGSMNFLDSSYVDLELLNCLSKSCIVYDVIYSPRETKLINLSRQLGLQTINGEKMNLEQAILAFHKATFGKISIEQIRSAMIIA